MPWAHLGLVAVFQVSEDLKWHPTVYHCCWDGVKAAKWNSMGLMQDFISPVELGPFCTWCNVIKRKESECGAQHGWSFPSSTKQELCSCYALHIRNPVIIGSDISSFMPWKSWIWDKHVVVPCRDAWMQLHCHLLHERIDAGWQVLPCVQTGESWAFKVKIYLETTNRRKKPRLFVWIQDFSADLHRFIESDQHLWTIQVSISADRNTNNLIRTPLVNDNAAALAFTFPGSRRDDKHEW